MKKIIYTFLVLAFAIRLSAVNYDNVEITPSTNTLVDDNPALAALLPADFTSTIFNGSGTPTMDRLYILMNIPAGMADYEIASPLPRIVLTMRGASLNDGFDMSTEYPSFTLTAGRDVCFSFIRDGSRYVLADIPFDPTTRALPEVTTPAGTSENVYITGTTADSLSAEMPEQVTILAPSYLNSMKQSFSDIFVQYIHSMVGSMLPGFSFNPNCEGFFQFTGGESSHLHMYTENLQMKVKSKVTDFLGSVVATNAQINLMGIDGPTNDSYTTYTDAELNDLPASDVEAFDENQIRSFTAGQIAIIASKMTAEQCNYLTPGQILGICGISDIVLAMDQSIQSQIGMTLYTTFLDVTKAQNADNVILPDNLMNAIGTQLAPLLSGSTMDMMGYLFGGMGDEMLQRLFSSMVEGSASPFAFKSNSTKTESQAFNVHIHSKGTNTITGGAEGNFKNAGTEMGAVVNLMFNMFNGHDASESVLNQVTELGAMFEAMVHFCSAPFAVRPSADVVESQQEDNYEYTCTRLLFDDIWTDGTTRTNGIMNMPVTGKALDAPSIDIGNPNGQVEFNGGQYRFHTPVSNKNINMFYVATMAICYREFNVNMPLAGNIKYRGIGTSVGWGPNKNRTDSYRNVIFHDGTFTTYSAEAWKSDARGAMYGAEYKIDAVANGWYEHYTDLRLPYLTSVLGGSFPEDTYVRRCDAAAEQGAKPVFIYIEDPSDPTSPQWITPLCERKELIANVDLADPADPTKANGTVKVTTANKQILTVKSGASSTTTQEYGTESITADANGKVYVYVTGDCVVDRNYVRNYVTALAPFGENHMGTNMLSLGGNVEVKSLYQDNVNFPLTNSYLLYTQLGYYTYKYAGVTLGTESRTLMEEFQIDQSEHHNFSDGIYRNPTDTTGVVFSEITNDGSYRIEHGIYSMLPIHSDMWMMFSMPYDVANIYILETTDEVGNPAWTNEQWHEYYQRQGVADGNMAQTLVTSVLPDIFSGRGSGIRQPLPYILNNLTNDKTTLTKLEHFYGSNFRTANFYLKKMKSEGSANHWKLEEEQDLYGGKWENAPRENTPTFLTETIEDPECDDWYDCDDITITFPYVDQNGNQQEKQTVVMLRDSVYAMYFPAGANRFWDYKYLILEGYGPQRIQGKNIHSTFASNVSGNMTYPAADYMVLQGNTSFGNHDMYCTSAQPIFVVNKNITAAVSPNPITPDSIIYNFAPYTGGDKRILPCSVYMVSGNNKAVRPAEMPALHNRPTELEGLPTLTSQQPSLVAYSDNGIYLEAYEDQHVRVFGADGRTLWSGEVKAGTKTFLPATIGLYIIQGQQTTIKLIN